MGGQSSKVTGGHWSAPGSNRTSSLGAARPFPPSADIGPGGQSVGVKLRNSAARFSRLTNGCSLGCGVGFTTAERAVAHVWGSYVPTPPPQRR